MPVLVLNKVNENNFTKDFDVGEHVIGRGPLLLCESKKVSRKHGMLRVTETEGIFFHAIHNNPCFYQSCNTTEIRIINFGKNVQITNNDKICLSLDDGWFKVQIKTDSPENVVNQNTSNIANLASTSAKRGIEEDIEEESPAKKSKMSDKDNNDTTLPCNENNVTNSELEREIKIEPIEENVDFELQAEFNSGGDQIEIKKEPANNEDTDTSKLLKVKEEKVDKDDCSKADDGNSKPVEVKKKKDDKDDGKKADDKNDNQPSTSTSASKVWKDRCWYGSSCYRRNPAHRSQFRHPGDADYDSDPNDTRPICSYGKECYRKNKEHRKRLRHVGQDTLGKPAPQKRKPPSRFVCRLGMAFDDDDDDEDDDDDDFDYVNDLDVGRLVVRIVNDNFDCSDDDSDIENIVVRFGLNHNANDSGVSMCSDDNDDDIDSDGNALWSKLWKR